MEDYKTVKLTEDEIDHILVAIATMEIVAMPPEAKAEYEKMRPAYKRITRTLVDAKA